MTLCENKLKCGWEDRSQYQKVATWKIGEIAQHSYVTIILKITRVKNLIKADLKTNYIACNPAGLSPNPI